MSLAALAGLGRRCVQAARLGMAGEMKIQTQTLKNGGSDADAPAGITHCVPPQLEMERVFCR